MFVLGEGEEVTLEYIHLYQQAKAEGWSKEEFLIEAAKIPGVYVPAFYDVSYSQVYNWVRKYLSEGEEGLVDKRGHHKTDDEVDELERLRRENLRLKRQLEERDMVVELLKKVKEFEGM